MKPYLLKTLILCVLLGSWQSAHAFCGFYVAKADTKLFNRASQVVLVRSEDKTVLTMANDFQGDPKEFAVVIPVPTFLEKDQIHVGERTVIEHLDAYSSPRLVEYFDPDPCERLALPAVRERLFLQRSDKLKEEAEASMTLGVKIEAQYIVGEYDIIILSASQSDGLEKWLAENGYKIPKGAGKVLESYIKQKMRFFVAKVNLTEKANLGYTYLRPLQVAYESSKFMLPIRLGTVNADGPQELFVYALTRKGRVETVNYRTVKLPTDLEIPVYVKEVFPDFYRAMFQRQVQREEMSVVFQEYAWDMGWCDPCAADPLTPQELRSLGVFWLDEAAGGGDAKGRAVPGTGQNVFVTRLHVRYDARHFPEDLVFQETADRSNFQGRYILRHPWTGRSDCPQAANYRQQLFNRNKADAERLAHLTGWDLATIHQRMAFNADVNPAGPKWYQKIWPN